MLALVEVFIAQFMALLLDMDQMLSIMGLAVVLTTALTMEATVYGAAAAALVAIQVQQGHLHLVVTAAALVWLVHNPVAAAVEYPAQTLARAALVKSSSQSSRRKRSEQCLITL